MKSSRLESQAPSIFHIQQSIEADQLLIRCIAQHLVFSKGRPVAACIIYKCLRQWRSFEVERTSIFDRIIQTIGQAIEMQDNNDVLAYCLSNASTLLLLLQRTLKASGAAGAPQHRRPSSASLFGRMTQGKIFQYGSISLITEPCKLAHIAATKVAKYACVILSYDPNLRLPFVAICRVCQRGDLEHMGHN